MALPRHPSLSRPLPQTVSLDEIGLAPLHPGEGGIVETPKSPGTRCPTCALEGKEVWVIPGRCCGYCGTPCDAGDHHQD